MTASIDRLHRLCLREPIADIEIAAGLLAQAAAAHRAGRREEVIAMLHKSNMQTIRDWTESIWGRSGKYAVTGPFANEPAFKRADGARMPKLLVQRSLHLRDGYYCRFCHIPLVRQQVRVFLQKAYPEAEVWGGTNREQHAALQCMWAQYDHVVPHARGGTNDEGNLVLTCAPCNYGRMQYTLEEARLADPRTRAPRIGPWRGLEELLVQGAMNEA